jgi:hypothetical protein
VNLAADLEHLRVAVLRSHGDAPVELRGQVEECAARIGGRPGSDPAALDPEVRAFVETIARHAYRVTDEDVAHLRHAGHGQDAIFEIVVSAALGAGAARFERARELLDGAT